MNTPRKHFDEMLLGANDVRAPYSAYDKWFAAQDPARLTKKSKEAEAFFRRTGITFNVYGQAAAQERLIPFDLIPRIIANREWTKLSKGIEQRVRAINMFLHDIYNRQEILRAGIVPDDLVRKNVAFLPQMMWFFAPRWCLYPHCRHRHRAHRRR